MEKDFGNFTLHINRYSFDNFALGLDCYKVYDYDTEEERAFVVQLSFLFFNVTLCYWKRGMCESWILKTY